MSACLYLSIIDGIDINSEVIEEISAWAFAYDNYYVFSRSGELCRAVVAQVSLDHGVDLKAVVISSTFPVEEAAVVFGFYFGFYAVETVCPVTAEFDYNDFSSVYFVDAEYLDCYKLVQLYSDCEFPLIGSIPVFQSSFKHALASLLALCEIDKKLMTGEGFLPNVEPFYRSDDTDLDCVRLSEITASECAYINFFEYEPGLSEALVNRKKSLLSMLGSIVPESSTMPSFRGYPSSYKALSAYFSLCSDIKLSLGAENSCFLYEFRALEVYCDGFLISQGVAEIGNIYRGRDQVLRFRDTFKLNGDRVLGFGKKWGCVRREQVVVSSVDESLLSKIDKAHNFRNKFNLTHGDLKITSNDLVSMRSDVQDFISRVEGATFQVDNSWVDMKRQFREFISYDVLYEMKELMRSKFPFEIIA